MERSNGSLLIHEGSQDTAVASEKWSEVKEHKPLRHNADIYSSDFQLEES